MTEIPKGYIEEHEPLVVYEKWKTRVGNGIEVVPLEFKGYVKSGKGTRYLIEGKYEGQRWHCRMPDGKKRTCISLVEVHPYDRNTKVVSEIDYELDMGRNPILHSYDYVTNEGPRTDNRDVITENKKNKKNLAALQWINTPESEALYNFLSHPCTATMRSWLRKRTNTLKDTLNEVKNSYKFNIWYYFTFKFV